MAQGFGISRLLYVKIKQHRISMSWYRLLPLMLFLVKAPGEWSETLGSPWDPLEPLRRNVGGSLADGNLGQFLSHFGPFPSPSFWTTGTVGKFFLGFRRWYSRMSVNATGESWDSLNMSEYVWICLNSMCLCWCTKQVRKNTFGGTVAEAIGHY